MLLIDSLRATAAPVEIKAELRSRTSAVGGRSGTVARENLEGESTRNINPWSKLVAKLLRELSLLAGSPSDLTGLRGLMGEKLPSETARPNHHCLRSSTRRAIERRRTASRTSTSTKSKHTMVIPAIAPPDNCLSDEVSAAVGIVGDGTPVLTVSELERSDDCEGSERPVANAIGELLTAAEVALTLAGVVCALPVVG